MKKFEIIDDNIIYKYQIYSGTRYHRGAARCRVTHLRRYVCTHTSVLECMHFIFVFRCTWVVTTMWMGTMSAPWILDGRMEECAKFPLEKRDYCNKENDKALTDCPVAAPAVSSICVSAIHVHYMYEH